MAGSEKNLMAHAQKAVTDKDYQWALLLSDQLLCINPTSLEVQKLKAISLRSLGARQIASTARNYYLTQALEAENKLHIGMMKIIKFLGLFK